ncbi:MAG: NADPH-dependent glutamate synthase [Erysipelotrichaceae bacterium]
MSTVNRNEMPVQDADVRNKNFSEVALGYTLDIAKDEASRCLNCKNARCIQGCPVSVNIPDFIQKVKENDINGAFDIVSNNHGFLSICGRVCPQENQCEKYCIKGIKGESVAIGRLERFVGDNHTNTKITKVESNGIKVACVGSGPASLACANELNARGFDVTIYEALHVLGGVLQYGIPEFRLPKAVVNREINALIEKGVHMVTDVVIGRTLTISQLQEQGFKAIFVGSGAGLPRFMGIENENAVGVFSANEYLTRVNLMHAYDDEYATPIKKYEKVCVVGGGNVAMDAARCAKRLGADVSIVYRRSQKEMPARLDEVEHALEEGIHLVELTNPTKVIINEDGAIKGLECEKMQLVQSDSGRASVKPISDSLHVIDCDCMIMSIGTVANPIIGQTSDIGTNDYGLIIVDEDQMTTVDNVYAGGDIVSGAATVILAMGAGKKAGNSIAEKLLAK